MGHWRFTCKREWLMRHFILRKTAPQGIHGKEHDCRNRRVPSSRSTNNVSPGIRAWQGGRVRIGGAVHRVQSIQGQLKPCRSSLMLLTQAISIALPAAAAAVVS